MAQGLCSNSLFGRQAKVTHINECSLLMHFAQESDAINWLSRLNSFTIYSMKSRWKSQPITSPIAGPIDNCMLDALSI